MYELTESGTEISIGLQIKKPPKGGFFIVVMCF